MLRVSGVVAEAEAGTGSRVRAGWGLISGVGGPAPQLPPPGDVRGLWGGAHDLRDLGEREGPVAGDTGPGAGSASVLLSSPSFLSASMCTFLGSMRTAPPATSL